jgi:hypothetical protein
MAPDPEITLKEFMEVRFEAAEKSADMRFKALQEDVNVLKAEMKLVKDCINNDVKHTIKLWRYIGSLIVGILMVLAAAWLRQRLGI